MLAESGSTAIAYETVSWPAATCRLLAPMSRIAGRMAVQAGTTPSRRRRRQGRAAGGIPGVARARVTVIGAGVAGWHAVDVAVGSARR